jgi:NAD(P)-dependent dehydrogenase (short-subunit alcohol dehydrogenase family)
METALSGRRIVVLGASSGIGRAVATCALGGGARVVVASRRIDRLREVAAAGDGVAVECDVRDAAERRRLADVAAHELGALDALVYMAARVPMVMMADESPDGWADLFATNASGAFLTFAALRPLLTDDAIVAYAASSGVGAPYHGRGAYTVSKAALDEGVRALRIEHPRLRFTRFVLDAVAGTEAAASDDPALAAQLTPEWVRRGRVLDQYLQVEEVGVIFAEMLATMFATGARIDEVALNGPGQPIALPFEMADVVAAVSGFRPDD